MVKCGENILSDPTQSEGHAVKKEEKAKSTTSFGHFRYMYKIIFALSQHC